MATLFDPESLPVESVAGESALVDEHLTAAWLRMRFSHPPRWLPEGGFESAARSNTLEPVPAAVLMPIVQRAGGLTMLLTKRAAHLTDHAGQISLPGGRAEKDDASPIETALREAEEEIGLYRAHVDVLGSLPDYVTSTGFRVTPVVSVVQPPFDLQADPFEVAEIFEVPLAFLMNGLHHQRRTVQFPEASRRTFYTIPYEHYFIWGATAGMLRNLFHFLRAE